MSTAFVTFRPATYTKGRESFITFYATDPVSGTLKRKRIKLNHIRKKTERDKYAALLCHRINEKLFEGWNPFVEEMGSKAVTIVDAVSSFMDRKRKEGRKSTVVSYSSQAGILTSWLNEKRLGKKYVFEIDHAILYKYMSDMEERRNLGGTTYNNYISFLVILWDYFIERDYTTDNPAAKLKRRRENEKKRVVIPRDVRARIKEYYLERIPNFYIVMQLCYRCFIRPTEIVSLKVENYIPDEGLLVIPGDVAKNHKERTIAVPDVIKSYLDTLSDVPSHYYIFGDPSTYAPRQKKIAHTRISECWAEMRKKLKLPDKYQFYGLKDTGITEMLEQGVPAKYVKELADHHSLAMTEKYTHKSDARKILEWNRIEL